MSEIWLRPNNRALWLAMFPSGLILCGGIVAIAAGGGIPLLLLACVCTVFGLSTMLGLIIQLARPRIAFADHQVLFYLRHGGPIAVPVRVVEGFFLGQGPALQLGTNTSRAESVNLVARLAERAIEWHHVDVKPALGRWCNGYITIQGTWCEPLTEEVVRRLNRRLAEVGQAESP